MLTAKLFSNILPSSGVATASVATGTRVDGVAVLVLHVHGVVVGLFKHHVLHQCLGNHVLLLDSAVLIIVEVHTDKATRAAHRILQQGQIGTIGPPFFMMSF